MTGSNRRPPPCKGGALPAELITPAVWSRIIGRVQNESTPFPKKLFVRRKFKQDDRKTDRVAQFLNENNNASCSNPNYIEESGWSDRISPTQFFQDLPVVGIFLNVRPFHENQNSLRAKPNRLSARWRRAYCSLLLAFCT